MIKLLVALLEIVLAAGIMYVEPDSGGSAYEEHDDINATCDNWNLSRDEGNDLQCANSRIENVLDTAWQEAVAVWTGTEPTDSLANFCAKFQVGMVTSTAENNVRWRVVAGPIDNSTDGAWMCGVNEAGAADEPLSCENKYWNGSALANPSGGVNGGSSGDTGITWSAGDYVVICFEGDVSLSGGGTVYLWRKSSDPCATDDTCQTTDMGVSDADLAISASVGANAASGTTIGVYLTSDNAAADPFIDGNFAAWRCVTSGVCGDL